MPLTEKRWLEQTVQETEPAELAAVNLILFYTSDERVIVDILKGEQASQQKTEKITENF